METLSWQDLRQNIGVTAALWLPYSSFLRTFPSSWPVSQGSASLHLGVVSGLPLSSPSEPYQSIVTEEQQGI